MRERTNICVHGLNEATALEAHHNLVLDGELDSGTPFSSLNLGGQVSLFVNQTDCAFWVALSDIALELFRKAQARAVGDEVRMGDTNFTMEIPNEDSNR